MANFEQQQGLARSRTVFGAALVAMIFGGCYPKTAAAPAAISPGSVTWAAEKFPGSTEASLAAGRETFLAKCNGCQGYPDLMATSDEEWPAIMERMGGKSDLDAEKTKGALQYVLAARHP